MALARSKPAFVRPLLFPLQLGEQGPRPPSTNVVDQFVLGLQMLFGVTAKAQALEVDDSSGQAAAAAEAVERPDKDHVELLPSGVGEQLSALRAVCAYAMGRFPRRTGF